MNKWNILIEVNGKKGIVYYNGFKTKKEASEMAEKWNKIAGHKATVIKY